MEIDKDGTIRFKEPEVFFNKGESEIKDQFKDDQLNNLRHL